MHRLVLPAVVAGMVFLVGSCRDHPKSPVIARVGPAVLTQDDLYKSIPPEYSDFITREQIVNYVKQWIDNKILYYEALRRKIDKEEAIRSRLGRMKEDLLCAEMVSRSAVPLQDIRVPDEMIEKYYDENKVKFMREQNVAKYVQIVCDDMNTASKVRALVTGDNFMSLAAKYSKVPPPDMGSVPYVKLDDIPPELAQEISSTPINGTTSVIKSSFGFCIVRVFDKQPKGTLCQLPEVKDDIMNILAAKMQNASLESLISSLRSKMIVETHLEVIAGQHNNDAHNAALKDEVVPADTALRDSLE